MNPKLEVGEMVGVVSSQETIPQAIVDRVVYLRAGTLIECA